ncbi:MAG: GlsB/YeaQ/YmgE family stress response membrane protein [Planctomycetaceae bacterium]|nr:GlsB/YeaQ/YmgE family stress response membrane protein [Planctomycetaceae bacterium]
MLFVDGMLWSLLIGAIAGWLAGLILQGRGFGLLRNILFGVVGAALANVLMGVVTLIGIRIAPWSMFGRLLAATLGALLLVWLLQTFRLYRPAR